ncbi:MAG: hypothetical protein ACREA0_00425 [bacterium]
MDSPSLWINLRAEATGTASAVQPSAVPVPSNLEQLPAPVALRDGVILLAPRQADLKAGA